MRRPLVLATFLLVAAITACTQPPGGGIESEPPSSAAPSNAEQLEASATPYTVPGY